MKLKEAKRIMKLVAQDNECGRAWEKQNIAARIILNELDKVKDTINKQTPKKVIQTVECSQACPSCSHPVNWKHCSNCGQALKY